MLCSLLYLATLALSALGLPSIRQTSDAPYSVDTATMAAAITCPDGITGKAGGIVLLVHGTGSTGSESWSHSPYYLLLPSDPLGPGFDICWIDLPGRSLGDCEVSGEYVAYAIQYLAPQSSTGQISIIGHSQGAGINPQWALDFWPSTRPLVSDYISLAGTFHGSGEGVIACTQQDLTQDGCLVSYIQQTTGSYYLQAQNTRGGAALVTTTSIYTHYDDIIQPENGPNPTSVLPGAANFALQDLDICGPAHVADHFMMVVDPAAYGLALDALSNPGPADASRFDPTYCTYFKSDELLNLTNVPAYVEAIVNDQVANGPRAFVEPMLMAYVCAEGQSTYC